MEFWKSCLPGFVIRLSEYSEYSFNYMEEQLKIAFKTVKTDSKQAHRK